MLIEDLMKELNEGSIKQPRPDADDAVFLNRIHDLEITHNLKWYEFMQKWDERKITPSDNEEKLDFAEWRVLCDKFSDRLEDGLEGLTITAMAGPPISGSTCLASGGPSNRAFLLCYTYMAHGSPTHHRSSQETAGERTDLFDRCREVFTLL